MNKCCQILSLALLAAPFFFSGYGAQSAPTIPDPPAGGPGWRQNEYLNAMLMDNRRGRDTHRPHVNKKPTSNGNVDSGTGNGNYALTIPLLNLPGRGRALTLNLYYNSLLWQETSNSLTMAWDHDHDWPAPGWSLGFGQMYQAGSSAYTIQDADGTRHMCAGTNTWDPSVPGWTFAGKTNDGTFIDCQATFSYSNGMLKSARALYSDGTIVEYGVTNPAGSALFPVQITDPNGNYISVAYRSLSCDANTALTTCGGPYITSITDTLGRVIKFSYDSNWFLTSITAPAIMRRTVLHLHYTFVQLKTNFAPNITIIPPCGGCGHWAIDAMVFPGDGTGYWFADPDSYSSYGMIAKVSLRRGMTFTPGPSDNEQGSISSGTMADERLYNYPTATAGGPTLSEAPSYTKMTETWVGMDTPPAVTTYSLQKFAGSNTCGGANVSSCQTLTTKYPDGSQSEVSTYTDTTDFRNGLVYDQSVFGPQPLNLPAPPRLSEVNTSYELGDYRSPRVTRVQKTNALARSRSTIYGYCNVDNSSVCWKFNQLTDITEQDYAPAPPKTPSTLKLTHIDYVTNQSYATRHIFDLPCNVIISDQSGTPLSQTAYTYDGQPLADASFVTGYDKTTGDLRGNITKVLRVTKPNPNWHCEANPQNRPAGVVEERQYDIAGNLRSSALGQVQTTYGYTNKTD